MGLVRGRHWGGGLPARVPCGDCTGWMYWGSCWIRRRSRATSCRERAMGSVGSSAERRRPLPGPGLLCQPCGGHPLLVRKSSVSYPSVLCECPVRRAERGVRSGARVLPLRVSRVTPSGAARTARVEGGSGPGGRGGEHGRTRVARPAKDSQGIGRQGFVSLGGLSALLSARQTGRVRGT